MIKPILDALLKSKEQPSATKAVEQDEHRFTLWKHFQDEANARKGELLQVMTFQLGLNAYLIWVFAGTFGAGVISDAIILIRLAG